jgi:SAM-dependent methyltransferase
MRRLRQLGASRWPRDAPVVSCSGRGNAQALEGLGFTNVTGVDLSPTLASRYDGSARVLVHDCRQLPFPDATYDVAVVHGGLHHLESLPDDLERTLSETRRVLRVGGRLVAVEPWRTPFLDLVHLVSERPAARVSPKLDAYQTMQDLEAGTFNRWVSVPDMILGLLRALHAGDTVAALGNSAHGPQGIRKARRRLTGADPARLSTAAGRSGQARNGAIRSQLAAGRPPGAETAPQVPRPRRWPRAGPRGCLGVRRGERGQWGRIRQPAAGRALSGEPETRPVAP